MEEIWKPILDFNGLYEISNLGNVKSLRNNLILKSNKCNSGYLKVKLYDKGREKTYMIHTLVAMYFLNHIPNGQTMVVNHINLNRLDNRLCNLEVISQRENSNQKHLKTTSDYVGVSLIKEYKTYNLYKASIRINTILIYLGDYKDEKYAADIYKIACDNIHKFNGDRKEFRELVKSMKFSESVINKGR